MASRRSSFSFFPVRARGPGLFKRLSWLVLAPALLLAPLAAHAEVRYTATPPGTVDGGHRIPFGTNEAGQVPGSPDTGDVLTHAFLYANGKVTDLGGQFNVSSDASGINDPASGSIVYEGSDINNNEQIVAYGFKPGYGTEAVRLDPVTSAVPEPAALGMLLLGLSTLAFLLPGFEWHRYSPAAGRRRSGVASVDWAFDVFARLRSLLVVGFFGPAAARRASRFDAARGRATAASNELGA